MSNICYCCGTDAQLVNYSQYCQRCYDAWERLQEADARHIFGLSCGGRPRKYASNAERQKAYRERQKTKALRNPLELKIEEIQMAMKEHGNEGFRADADWINTSARLFDELMAARRALRAATKPA